MCGRYTLARSQQELSERFGIAQLFIDFHARYNIAPTQKVPVILIENGQKTMDAFQWGLIPSWTKEVKSSKPLINARVESLLEKPSFKSALTDRRCLVPADGFYEWKKSGANKRPQFIHRADNAIFAFAGIWDEWQDAQGQCLRTFSIITGPANEAVANVHDRMPIILSPGAEESWLDPRLKEPAKLVSLLGPCPSKEIAMHEVSPEVNSARPDGPELIEPSGGQLGLDLSF